MSNIIAIVGRPNVGKSTLFNRIVKQREAIVDSISGVTRDRHYGKGDWNGKEFSLRLYGARALMSLRLEKNWGAWTLDFRPDFTAAESGLDTFINWNKEFVGKKAALDEKKQGPKRKNQ